MPWKDFKKPGFPNRGASHLGERKKSFWSFYLNFCIAVKSGVKRSVS
jgi:hypothetical protein